MTIPSKFNFSIFARDRKTEQSWMKDLQAFRKGMGNALGGPVTLARDEPSSLILVDAGSAGWQDWIAGLNPEGKSVVLVIEEEDFLPRPEELELAHDVLVYPFRLAELMSIARHHQERRMSEALIAESKLAEQELNEANRLVERILQAKTPKRFHGLKGLHIQSRHLSGLKPGGDYFDVFESDKKDFVNFLLVDSSNYGISSALLGMILSSSARMANDQQRSTADWVKSIYEEIKVTLGDQGHFSVFFGRLNRRDFSLHYQLFGSIESYVVQPDGIANRLEKHGKVISNSSLPEDGIEKVVRLNPKDRLVLLSDGFVKGVGGEFHLDRIFKNKIEQDPFSLVNELAFQIKAKLQPGETFPGEDCSAIVIDVENRVLRLAPTG